MKKTTILSIDDEESFPQLMKEYFEPRGFELDTCFSGKKGFELINNKHYDVLLLDLKMAGLDGTEVMRSVLKKYPDIKIIFISAYTDSGKTKQMLLEEGAYAFVEKPLSSLKHLEKLILEAVGASSG